VPTRPAERTGDALGVPVESVNSRTGNRRARRRWRENPDPFRADSVLEVLTGDLGSSIRAVD